MKLVQQSHQKPNLEVQLPVENVPGIWSVQ